MHNLHGEILGDCQQHQQMRQVHMGSSSQSEGRSAKAGRPALASMASTIHWRAMLVHNERASFLSRDRHKAKQCWHRHWQTNGFRKSGRPRQRYERKNSKLFRLSERNNISQSSDFVENGIFPSSIGLGETTKAPPIKLQACDCHRKSHSHISLSSFFAPCALGGKNKK